MIDEQEDNTRINFKKKKRKKKKNNDLGAFLFSIGNLELPMFNED